MDGGWGGRPLSGDPQDALCRLGPSQRGDPPLAKGGCCSPTQRPPLQLRAPHLSPFSSSSAGRAKGPAFPPRGSSTKPGRGRGRAIPGSTRVEAARAPRRCPAPARAPPRAAQLQQPRSWFLARSLACRGQLPGISRYQLGLASLQRPTDSRGPHLRPPALVRRATLAGAPERTRPPAPAPTPRRPNLPPPRGQEPGLGGSGLN